MILELALVLAGGAATYVLVRRGKKRGSSPREPTTEDSSLRPSPNAAPEGLLAEGDVVGIGDAEYWLTDALWLYEDDQSVGVVYRAEDSYLVVLPGARPRVYLGQELYLELPPEFPALLEAAAQEFSLRSRIPVRVRATSGVLEGHWARYEGGIDQSLWILRTTHQDLCLSTRSVPERLIFRWGRVSV